MDKVKFFMQSSPLAPEKLLMGVQGKHGKRLDTYAHLTFNQQNVSDALVGFKTRFVGGEVRGSVSTSGKVESIYRKFVSMFEMEMRSSFDLFRPAKPVEFGVALSLRGM